MTQENPLKGVFEHLALGIVRPSKNNPRSKFDITELILSIKESGIITPLLVRPMASKDGNYYEVVCGHRRLAAAASIGLDPVPCIVRAMSDSEASAEQAIENLQREDIHPMDEAIGYQAIIKSFKATPAELAKRFGKPEHYIAQRLKLLDLVKEARKAYAENELGLEYALLIAKMIPEDQENAVDFLTENEDVIISIHTFKEWIQEEITLNLTKAPFSKENPELIPYTPACIACPKNSGFNTALFPELKGTHVCGDRHCFRLKMEAHIAEQKKLTRKDEKRQFIMISTKQLEMDNPLKVDGVKMEGRYKIVKAGNECEDTKRAQWVDGQSKGKFTQVCNYSKCSKHFKENHRPGDRSSSAAATKPEDKEKEIRKQHAEQKQVAIREKLVVEACRTMTMLFNEIDALQYVMPMLGRDCHDSEEKAILGESRASLLRRVGKMKGHELARVAVGLALLDARAWGDEHAILKDAAARKVDLKAIEKKISAEFHDCEVCGCNEASPCSGGCSWHGPAKMAGKWVCSACVEKDKVAATALKAKSPAKATKAPKPVPKKKGSKR